MLYHYTFLYGESTNSAFDVSHTGIFRSEYFFLLVVHTLFYSA